MSNYLREVFKIVLRYILVWAGGAFCLLGVLSFILQMSLGVDPVIHLSAVLKLAVISAAFATYALVFESKYKWVEKLVSFLSYCGGGLLFLLSLFVLLGLFK